MKSDYEEAMEKLGKALEARRNGAEQCQYWSMANDGGNNSRCQLLKDHDGPHLV